MEAVAMRSSNSTMGSRTEVLTLVPTRVPQTPPILRLRLRKPRNPRRVGWSDDTVDNEHMCKKKSKCCCIYRKPIAFGESSSEEEEQCEHCFGHPEKRPHCNKQNEDDNPQHQHQYQHNHSPPQPEHRPLNMEGGDAPPLKRSPMGEGVLKPLQTAIIAASE